MREGEAAGLPAVGCTNAVHFHLLDEREREREANAHSAVIEQIVLWHQTKSLVLELAQLLPLA